MVAWYVYAIATAVLAAAASIVEKRTLDFKDESPLEYSTMFAFLNAGFSLFLLPLTDLTFSFGVYGLIFLTALLGSTLGFLLVAHALKRSEISQVSPLLNINPLFVTVLAVLFLGESLTQWQVGGIALTAAGAYVLEAEGGIRNIVGPLKRLVKEYHARIMLLAAFVYSVSSVLGKYVLGFVDPVTLLVLLHLFIAFNFAGMMLYRSDGGLRHRMSSTVANATKNWGWVLMAAVFTTSYRLLQLEAVSLTFVSLVIPIKRMSTLISTVVGGELFGEEHLLRKSVACLVMIAGAYLIIVGKLPF